MTDFEDDVRAMLHRRAGDAVPSADGWEQIQARLEAEEQPTSIVRRRPFHVLTAGAAAAAAAALVAGQLIASPTSQVATSPPASTAPAAAEVPDTPWVWPVATARAGVDPLQTAAVYLEERTGTRPTGGEVTRETDDAAQVLFRSGPVVGEVFLKQAGDRWFVDSAASDLIPLFDTAYDGDRVRGDATAESDGTVEVAIEAPDASERVTFGPTQVAFRDPVPIEGELREQHPHVVVRVVLETPDGTHAVSERWVLAADAGQAGEGVDTYQGIWPRTSDELAGLEDGGDASDHDPEAVAAAFLDDVVLSGQVRVDVGTFMQGDQLSGEVPFTLSDGGRGLVLVRRASPDASMWFVTFATTDGGPFDVRTEDGGITVESTGGIATFSVEARPLPDGEVVSAAAEDGVARIDGTTEAVVKVVGTADDGGIAFTVSRTSAAG